MGALVASNYASKAQKEFNKSIIDYLRRKNNVWSRSSRAVQQILNANLELGMWSARNAEDGISASQLVESSLMEIASLAQRLRELAIQADNADILSMI